MTLDEALIALEEEKAARKKVNQVIMVVAAAVLAVAAAGLGFGIATAKDDLLTSILPSLGLMGFVGMAAGFTPRAKSALLAAAESGDPRVLGHLIEAASLGDVETQALAKGLAQDLLAKAGEASIPLDHVQHSALTQALVLQDEAFRLAAVRALPWIGRKESIPILETLAKGEKYGIHKTSPELRAAAERALPDLRIRLAKDIILAKIAEVDSEREKLVRRIENGGQKGTEASETGRESQSLDA